jgi:two-component system, NtrC family, sensor histidine kinase HydH
LSARPGPPIEIIFISIYSSDSGREKMFSTGARHGNRCENGRRNDPDRRERMSKADSYKKQETILILLNISVLAALFVTHIGFISLLGRPSALLLTTLSARFIILVLELFWIQQIDSETSPGRLDLHTHFSVWLNIAFAFAASYLGGTADSHYSVLMIIPIITAAYRYRLRRTLAIAAVAVVLTFLEVWLYYRQNPPSEFSEYFEAATVSLIFLVVGLVVWLLVDNLRSEEQKLQTSLSELRLVQEKLVAEEKMAAVGQLSSAVAHEIRNPVAMIASSLQLAEKQAADSPLREEMFRIATEEARRLEILTSDFLAFARTRPPAVKKENVRQTLEYIADLSKARLAEKNCRLAIDADAALTARFDSAQMQQALLNLLLNATDAAPGHSTVLVGAEERAGRLTLFVENAGEQIDESIAARIFEPFFTNKPKGTGLGLSIVRKIAQLHGGDARLAVNEAGRIRFELEIPDQ